jgi:hypothetical protein
MRRFSQQFQGLPKKEAGNPPFLAIEIEAKKFRESEKDTP